MEELKEEICAEFALTDAMDRILRYLNVRDLSRAAQVCKAWDEAVQLELTKRGPQRLLVPDTYNEKLLKFDEPRYRLSDNLWIKPEFAIFLCGPRVHVRLCLKLEEDILTIYKPRLPRYLLILGVDVAMMDDQEIRSCPSGWESSDKKLPNGIIGFFLPKFRQDQIKLGFCESHEFEVQKKADKIVDDILPDDRNVQSTILLFGRSQYSIAKTVVCTIRKKFRPNSYTIWGGTMPNYLKTIDCREDDFPAYTGMEGCIAISISGSGLERYSAVISYRQTLRNIEREMADFKKGLKLKRHSHGLLCSPRRRSDPFLLDPSQEFSHEDLMRIVKSAFPELPFIGFFNDSDIDYFGMDSRIDDADQTLMHRMCMSILILTHD